MKKHQELSCPRCPTWEELQALSDYLWRHCPALHPKDAVKWSGLYPAAVFDRYVAIDGSYAGSIMVVVWMDNPRYHQVFTFNRYGDLELVAQDAAMQDPDAA
jgi:hypothetical protein